MFYTVCSLHQVRHLTWAQQAALRAQQLSNQADLSFPAAEWESTDTMLPVIVYVAFCFLNSSMDCAKCSRGKQDVQRNFDSFSNFTMKGGISSKGQCEMLQVLEETEMDA